MGPLSWRRPLDVHPANHGYGQSLRIVPADSHASSFQHVAARTQGAPSAPGVHDTLRQGVGPSLEIPSSSAAVAAVESAHPLEARLKAWEGTQEGLRMEMLRRTYGIAEPVRRGMELKITGQGEWRPAALAAGSAVPSVHEDILRGREASLDWEDVFTGHELRSVAGVHDEMERKLKMQ